MTYRRVYQFDAEGHPKEVFDIRISDEGFAEWAADREFLRRLGHPDRPPDVDTPHLRAWVPHPGEEDHPYFIENPDPDPDGPFPAFSVSWTTETEKMRLMVTAEPDGGFEVTVQSNFGVGFLRQYPKEMGANAVGDHIEDSLARLNEGLPEDVEVDVKVTTFTDYLDFAAEMELAKADIARGFINPLSTEGTIQ